MNKPIFEDPVVAEIHETRRKMLEECGGDHRKLMQQVAERQQTSGKTILSVPKPPRRPAKANQGNSTSE